MDKNRMSLLNELVNEVTSDFGNPEKIKSLAESLGITYSDDPMQFLNNVLKGIHSKGSADGKNEQNT